MRHAEAISDRLLVSALAVGGESSEWLLLSVDCIGLDRGFTAFCCYVSHNVLLFFQAFDMDAGAARNTDQPALYVDHEHIPTRREDRAVFTQ